MHAYGHTAQLLAEAERADKAQSQNVEAENGQPEQLRERGRCDSRFSGTQGSTSKRALTTSIAVPGPGWALIGSVSRSSHLTSFHPKPVHSIALRLVRLLAVPPAAGPALAPAGRPGRTVQLGFLRRVKSARPVVDALVVQPHAQDAFFLDVGFVPGPVDATGQVVGSGVASSASRHPFSSMSGAI